MEDVELNDIESKDNSSSVSKQKLSEVSVTFSETSIQGEDHDSEGCVLVWKNLTVVVKEKKKVCEHKRFASLPLIKPGFAQ